MKYIRDKESHINTQKLYQNINLLQDARYHNEVIAVTSFAQAVDLVAACCGVHTIGKRL